MKSDRGPGRHGCQGGAAGAANADGPALALLAWVGWKIHRRWGEAACRRFDRHFDDWEASTHPKAARVLELLRSPARRAEVFDTPAG